MIRRAREVKFPNSEELLYKKSNKEATLGITHLGIKGMIFEEDGNQEGNKSTC